MLPTSKLLPERPEGPRQAEAGSVGDPPGPEGSVTVPSIVVDDVDGNDDDDPPPYTAIAPPNHVGWPFDFSGIPYSACATAPCRTEVPLAPFQTALTSGSSFHPEGTDSQHTSIPMPLMPCRLFKFGSHRSLFPPRGPTFADNISVSKDIHSRTRRYGAILVGAAVIIFLMALSILVRFVMEKSFWRG